MKRTGFLRAPSSASRLTVKLRKCKAKGCSTRFAPAKPFQVWCSDDCGAVLALEKLVKLKQGKVKAERKADRAKREKLKTRSDWIREAQASFNAFIRERDKDKPCICCGRTSNKQFLTGSDWDCGHYRSTGSAPHLRFDERNAHRQLVVCNRHGAGRAVDYRIGLIKRIGLEAVEALESDQVPRKWSIPELVEIKAKYRNRLKELQAKSV